jgi:large subunit ribosomal protein L25
VKSGEKVTVEIPVNVTGEIVSGNLLDQQLVTIALEAEATHIPTGVEVSVEGLDAGAQIFAKDLKLPAGTTLIADEDALVLQVTAQISAEAMEASLGETPAEAPATEAPAEEAAAE